MSAAQRREQRRLRSWWRHEQQSIAAALATRRCTRAGEEESETKYTAKFRTRLFLPSRCSSACTTKSLAGGGLPAWQSRRGHRSGSRGTPWSILSTLSALLPWCRSSMLLCRRRWNSCQTSSGSLTRSCLIPSRSSKCPRSRPRTSPCALLCANRSWWNSWWKCRLSCLLPCRST